MASDGGGPAFGQRHLVARLLERDGQQVAHALLVVHHQNPWFTHIRLVSRRRHPAHRVRMLFGLICGQPLPEREA